ncbi:MAG: hypothetical protein KC413_03270 [Anaerolineales bacterium]|nr:hypothetical protein [Anaerolineales bacterium]MCA9974737.1 hypothetical protein [Anaerolineales bacterium]
MIKKLILGTLFAGLLALLIIGGMRRTQDKLEQAAETVARQNGNGNGNTYAATDSHDDHEATAVTATVWQTVTASVTDVRPNGLWLQLANNQTVRIRRQPWAFAQTQGFNAQIGDTVRLTGYSDASNFEVCTAENLTSGHTVHLRDEHGHSLWDQHE